MEFIPAVANAARSASDSRGASSSSASATSNGIASAGANSGRSFGDLVRQAPEKHASNPRDVASIEAPARNSSESTPQDNTSPSASSASSPGAPAESTGPSSETARADEELNDGELIVDPSAADPAQTSLSVADALSSQTPDIAPEGEALPASPVEQTSAPTPTPHKAAKPPSELSAAKSPGAALPPKKLPENQQLFANDPALATGDSVVEVAEGVEFSDSQTADSSTIDESEVSNTEQLGEVDARLKSADGTDVLKQSGESSPNVVPDIASSPHGNPDAAPSNQAEPLGAATHPAISGIKSVAQPNAEGARGAATLRQQFLQPAAAAAEIAATAAPVITELPAAASETQAATEDIDNSAPPAGPLETQDANTHAELEPAVLTEEGERRLLGHASRRGDSTVPASAETSTADRVRLIQRIAGAFQASLDRGGEISLSLHPPNLGQLNVEVQMREGKLSARLEAESTSVQQLLLDSLPQLRERLAEHQIKIEQFQVDVINQHNSHFAQTPHDRPDRQRSAEALLPRNSSNGSNTNQGSQQTSRQDRTPRLNGAPWMLDRLNVLV